MIISNEWSIYSLSRWSCSEMIMFPGQGILKLFSFWDGIVNKNNYQAKVIHQNYNSIILYSTD